MFNSQRRSEQASQYSATVMSPSVAMMRICALQLVSRGSSGRHDRLAVLS